MSVRRAFYFLAQNRVRGGGAPAVLEHGGIVLARGVDVRVPQDVRNQIDVLRGAVQIGAVGAAQLVRADLLLERRGNGGILLDQVFNRALRDAPALD